MVPVWNRLLGWRVLGFRADLWFLVVFTATALILLAAGYRKPAQNSAQAPEPEAASTDESEIAEPPEGISKAEGALLSESVSGMSRKKLLPLYVYRDAGMAGFYPDGWMGDYRDVKMDPYWESKPHSGRTCTRVRYEPGASLNCRWAGVYWMFPGNSWGKRKGGYDLSGAKKLRFWARGEFGGEVIQEFKIGGIAGKFRDSDTAGIGPIELSTDWKEYEIDLSDVDLTYISGGFCWSTNLDQNREGCTFYLDDIVYE